MSPDSLLMPGRLVDEEPLEAELEDPHPPRSTAPPSPAAPARNVFRSIELTIVASLVTGGETNLPVI